MSQPGWTYNNPVEVIFGNGRLSDLPQFVNNRRTILITTPGFTTRGVVDSLNEILGASLVGVFDCVQGYPTFTTIKDTSGSIASADYEIIIALGGGSTLDTAKAVAATVEADSPDWLDDHLKGGETFPANFRPKPIIAIPTTAGTGSEVTMWGSVWDFDAKKKYSISHPALYAEKALLDSELTASLPEKDTIYGALDALSHAMEAIWNKNHNPISDAFALKAIELVTEYLPQVKNDPGNRDFRDFLLQASLLAGLAFSNTKTALAHSISYPLTTLLDLPHGLACALPLSHILEFNGNHDIDRIKIMAAPLKSPPTLESMRGAINHLFQEVGVSSRLKDHGADEAKLAAIAASAYTPGRADNNLRPVEQEDVTALVNKLF